MDTSLLLLKGGMNQPCLISGYLSVKAMLKAVYLCQGSQETWKNNITFDELLSFVSDHHIIDLDTELFLNKIHYITSQSYILTTLKMENQHVINIITRIEDILCYLSEKIGCHDTSYIVL
ncbi:hypothetical protein [Paenibacillus crassostreae]|nr:hypothetical protein [Paenibacillus crassostreae]